MSFVCAASRAMLLAAAASLIFTATVAQASHQFQVLYAFKDKADGGRPHGSLILDREGNLYGTTVEGGTAKCRCGVVFRLSPGGEETPLYAFHGHDGYHPVGPLVRNKAGDVFGVTQEGGKTFDGAVFRLSASGNETVLHSFSGIPDGSGLNDGLTIDRDGNLYGATTYGGIGDGTVFKVTPDGTETVLHTFRDGENDGAYAYSGVIRDRKGNLYGTTMDGGSGGQQQGPGILYKLTPGGKFTVLHHFEARTGDYPSAAPLMDAGGNLYGTTIAGGDIGQGTVYKYADGTYSVLHSFGGQNDGEYGIGRLVMDGDGSLYGVTQGGGAACDCGIVFKLAPDGTYTVLHRFTGGDDGGQPADGLVMDGAGNLFGTAYQGGKNGDGVVFKIRN
ncbi:MAG: choice-of-anchor tandem repeat GloVer-containing protein [Alphaproteobacteria bacterium]|jgi:uncharacterized repeat protein (TIGR03803 family)